MTTLMKRVKARVSQYVTEYMAASSRWGKRVFGQLVPTKGDVRKDFIADMKMLAEVAALEKDQKVLDLIQGSIKSDEQQVQDDIKAIEGITIPQ